MNVKSRKQPVVPKIGVWYHRKEKSLYGGDHRVFYLCTQINEQNPNKVMLYYCKKGIIKTVWAERDELREAFWLVTNRFHQFCLLKLREILNGRPTQDELVDDHSCQLDFGFSTQFRVYRAGNDQRAIDQSYDIINKKLKDDKMPHEERKSLIMNHKKLIDEFNKSLEHHFMAS